MGLCICYETMARLVWVEFDALIRLDLILVTY